MICKLCNRSIGILGWPKHVSKHKKELGENCYRINNKINKIISEANKRMVKENNKKDGQQELII